MKHYFCILSFSLQNVIFSFVFRMYVCIWVFWSISKRNRKGLGTFQRQMGKSWRCATGGIRRVFSVKNTCFFKKSRNIFFLIMCVCETQFAWDRNKWIMNNDSHIKRQDYYECSRSGDMARKRYFSMILFHSGQHIVMMGMWSVFG